jgi:tetratricopeptide (TPR) repeat protein
LNIFEKARGPDHIDVAKSLNNLALQYSAQGRYAAAGPLFKRALEIMEKTLGRHHPDVGVLLTSLAALYIEQDSYGEAEPLFERALAIDEQALGPDHPDIATDLHNLAELNRLQGRHATALPLYERALAISRKSLGPDHPNLAASLDGLGRLYAATGRPEEAEAFYGRALEILEKTFGADHPNGAATLAGLADLHSKQRNFNKALDFSRRATGIYQNRAILSQHRTLGGRLSEQKKVRGFYLSHIGAIAKILASRQSGPTTLVAEGFKIAQFARATGTAAAIAGMAARFATGDDMLARLVREQQDRLTEWARLDSALIAVVGRPRNARNAGEEAAQRQTLDETTAAVARLSERLAHEFPAYAEHISAKPVALSAI